LSHIATIAINSPSKKNGGTQRLRWIWYGLQATWERLLLVMSISLDVCLCPALP
jgi:hypothetical protein